MGYSEYRCQICGVSFAIGRIRTPQEPPSAAWDNHGTGRDGYVYCYAPEDDDADEEESSGKICPKEDASGCMIAVRLPHDHEDGDLLPPSQHLEEEMYFYQMRANPKQDRPRISKRLRDIERKLCLEHIAGLECGNGDGYDGNRISFEEMRTCTTMQGLVAKSPDWEPEDGDEEFERSGRYFLSGLVDSLTTIDSLYSESCYPKRHGCDHLFPITDYADIVNQRWQEECCCIPIHPACLETFKRVTLYRYGHIDVGAFTQWWELDNEAESLTPNLDNQDLRESRSQWWRHLRGLEYLAADPCFVPNLGKAFLPMTTCIAGHDSNLLAEDAGIFSSLPSELRSLIFDHLSLDDISNLQLASPLLSRHSQDELRRRLIREWPWLWEGWTDLKYSAWVGLTARDLRESLESPEKQVVVSKDDLVNWGSVFRLISRGMANDQLKGLKNRQRIWKRCEQILNGIESYRNKTE